MTSTTTLTMSSSPQFSFTSPDNTTRPTPPARQRSSSLLHKTAISRMRPLPFQYVFELWHTKVARPSSSSTTASTSPRQTTSNSTSPTRSPTITTPEYTLTNLADSIPDIASFYRIFNNFPFSKVQTKDSVHFFRTGVKPLWEDPQNRDGGCWTIKVRKDDGKALKAWEELCLMVLGGELQSVVAAESNHILGITYSPRLYHVLISLWTKNGPTTPSLPIPASSSSAISTSDDNGIKLLQTTIIERLSPDVRPSSDNDYYFKRHSDHAGWKQVVEEGSQADMKWEEVQGEIEVDA